MHRTSPECEGFRLIYYLVTKEHDYTIRSFLSTWGKSLKPYLKVMSYETLFRKPRLSAATYIFSDIERLTESDAQTAALIVTALGDQWGASIQMLNHPTVSMTRYELLRRLHSEGVNDFNVYRLTEALIPERFPVFIRNEDDHEGSLSELMETPEALFAAIRDIETRGVSRRNKMITEYCDTSDSDGIFRKYSCFCLAGEIIPRHVCFGRHWMLKYPELTGPEQTREEMDFVQSNPHERQIREIFALARIDYGRIDYSFKNGRIQVWEINTNPGLVSFLSAGVSERLPLHEAFLENFTRVMRKIDRQESKEKMANPAYRVLRSGRLTRRMKNWSMSTLYTLPVSISAKARLLNRLVAFKRRMFQE
jgi:hypothetical protein